MRVTMGMFEPLEFFFCNSDGVPIDLTVFSGRLLFWYPIDPAYDRLSQDPGQHVVLMKMIEQTKPYSGEGIVMLTDDDTIQLARSGRGTLRWSVFLINDEQQVFPMQITQQGERYGIVDVENEGLPTSEVLNSLAYTATP